jgi:hypothetical protein
LIFECNSEDITTCISIIKQGGVVVFPPIQFMGLDVIHIMKRQLRGYLGLRKEVKPNPFLS